MMLLKQWTQTKTGYQPQTSFQNVDAEVDYCYGETLEAEALRKKSDDDVDVVFLILQRNLHRPESFDDYFCDNRYADDAKKAFALQESFATQNHSSDTCYKFFGKVSL